MPVRARSGLNVKGRRRVRMLVNTGCVGDGCYGLAQLSKTDGLVHNGISVARRLTHKHPLMPLIARSGPCRILLERDDRAKEKGRGQQRGEALRGHACARFGEAGSTGVPHSIRSVRRSEVDGPAGPDVPDHIEVELH